MGYCNKVYKYTDFRELGKVARIANKLKTDAPKDFEGKKVTKTQRSFWILGWEAEDNLQARL
jgi:hypothetical protein